MRGWVGGAHLCRVCARWQADDRELETTWGHEVRPYQRACVRTGYWSDVRGCKVLDSAKKISMTLRAAGRSAQRFTRVDKK